MWRSGRAELLGRVPWVQAWAVRSGTARGRVVTGQCVGELRPYRVTTSSSQSGLP